MASRQRFTQSLRFGSLGGWLRALREERALPLRDVAAAARIDSTLLSKIELGQRMPTQPQASLLADFFGVPTDELEAARIAEKFWRDHGDSPVAALAIARIQESAGEYLTGKPSKPVSKRTKMP